MTEQSIQDVCRCTCESTELTPQMLKAMRQSQITGTPPPAEVSKKADELAKQARGACIPRFVKIEKGAAR